MAQNPAYQTEVPKIVLGVAAHPDDLDFGAAGTIAYWASRGARVYYLILTNGNKGSEDLSAKPEDLTELRRNEQRAAAKILGVADVFFCDYEDGCLMVSMDVKRDIARVIRKVRPDTVITMDPGMLYDVERGFINHPDHRAAGQATLDALYPLARDHMSFPELFHNEGLAPHKVATVLLTNFQQQNCYIDISDTFDKKIQALAAHASQIPGLPTVEQMMRDFAGRLGQDVGVRYAEGFIRIDIH
ncbi:MAG: putative deacetylase [Candidatus Saccharibacteria bacterium]|nr:putative deacetylase [Candidatus Saccharibacteria bacterium]